MTRDGALRCAPFAALIFLAACSGNEPPSTDGVGEAVAFPPPRRVVDPEAELYDERGVPRESDQRVAGLVLPRGLTEIVELRGDRRHVYTSRVPHQKMLRYFGPRLMTLEVEHRGGGVIYRNAVPRGVRGGVVRLDVRVAPTSAEPTRVEIVERPPPPPEGVVIPEDEIRRHFESIHADAE